MYGTFLIHESSANRLFSRKSATWKPSFSHAQPGDPASGPHIGPLTR